MVARKTAIGGSSETALNQVARGDTEMGIQGNSFPKSAKDSAMACRPGNAVQTSGGSGINCTLGTSTTAQQNSSAKRACPVHGSSHKRHPQMSNRGRLSACRMASDRNPAFVPPPSTMQHANVAAPTRKSALSADRLCRSSAINLDQPCCCVAPKPSSLPALPHADFMRHFG